MVITGLRVVGPATDIALADPYRAICEQSLRREVAWLELDQRIDSYHDFGGGPADQSQGWFPFGMTGARKVVAHTLCK